MPSQAPAAPVSGPLVARADGARSALLALAGEVGAVAGAPPVAVPPTVSGTVARNLRDTLAAHRLAALDVRAMLAGAGHTVTAAFGSGQPPLAGGYDALAAGLNVLRGQVTAALDGETGSGIRTVVGLIGPGASIWSGSAITAAGEPNNTTDWSPGFTLPQGYDEETGAQDADARVWLDGAFGPVADPDVGTGIRRKQGSVWPRFADLLSLNYRSPGGQLVRVRLIAFSKGSAVLHVSKHVSNVTTLGFGDVNDPDSLWRYLVEQWPAFWAAVQSEPGFDPRYVDVIGMVNLGNEAEMIREDPDPSDPREITVEQLRARFAGIPDQYVQAIGMPVDVTYVMPTGGPPADPDIPILGLQRSAEIGGIADAVAAGHNMVQMGDSLRDAVLEDAAIYPTRLNIEDSVHPSKRGYNVHMAPGMAAVVASDLGLTPAP